MQDAGWTYKYSRRAAIERIAGLRGSFLTFLGLAVIISTCGSAVKAADSSAELERSHDISDSENIVHLYATAVVKTDQVRLADLARIEGGSAHLAGSCVIATAPHHGQSKVVSSDKIQSVLARRGANLGRWIFRGASCCKVTRIAKKNSKDESNNTSVRPNKNTFAIGQAGRMLDSTSGPNDQGCDPNTLEGVLRQHLSARLVNIKGEKIVQFNPAIAKLLALSAPTYQFRIVDRSDRLLGTVPLEVTIYEQEKIKQVLQVLADVTLKRTVVVTTRQINRHEIVQSSDVEIKEKLFSRLDEFGLADTKPVVGQRAKHYIGSGVMVFLRDVETVPLVKRNDVVTVRVQRGNCIIKGSAKALQSGGYGDSVELKSEMSKQRYTAVVTGYKAATVPAEAGVSPIKPVFERRSH